MKNLKKSGLALTALTLGLAACSTPPRTQNDPRDGWREGAVELVSTYGALPFNPGNDCAKKANASASTQVAIIRYRHHDNIGQRLDSHEGRFVVLAGPQSGLTAGANVLINPQTCEVKLQKG